LNMDFIVEFLILFIAAGGGFIIGIGFMMVVYAKAMKNMQERMINRLKEELSLATGNCPDEHREVGRPPP